jgi:hypothetical protein
MNNDEGVQEMLQKCLDQLTEMRSLSNSTKSSVESLTDQIRNSMGISASPKSNSGFNNLSGVASQPAKTQSFAQFSSASSSQAPQKKPTFTQPFFQQSAQSIPKEIVTNQSKNDELAALDAFFEKNSTGTGRRR